MSLFDGVRQTRPKHVQAQKKAAKVGQGQTECDDVLDSFTGLGPTWILYLSLYQVLIMAIKIA